jgi:heme/copper-type cytochrome/quinol oxidase subunit 3
MAEMTAPGGSEAATRAVEENAFYHEAALNASWTGSRLAIAGLSFLFGCFAFAYFYLQAANSHQMWLPSSTTPPSQGWGMAVMVLVVVSALVQTAGLAQLKAGRKGPWMQAAPLALLLGLAAVAVQITELLSLPFQPGASGFASVFTGFYPVALSIWLCAMIWLEILFMRARPSSSSSSRPPTRRRSTFSGSSPRSARSPGSGTTWRSSRSSSGCSSTFVNSDVVRGVEVL